MSKRMLKEDTKLKQAIGKHYKKLVGMERNRLPGYTFKFSDCIVDLLTTMGYVKSEKHSDELSRPSSMSMKEAGNDDDDTSVLTEEVMALSEGGMTRHTVEKYASVNIDEDQVSLATKILEATKLQVKDKDGKGVKPRQHSRQMESLKVPTKARHHHPRLNELESEDYVHVQQPSYVDREPTSAYDNQFVKIVANNMATDLTNRYSLMIDKLSKDGKEEDFMVTPATHETVGVTYLGDQMSNTIDLVGEPTIKTFFSGYDTVTGKSTTVKDPAKRFVSTGTDFHQTYVPPYVVKD